MVRPVGEVRLAIERSAAELLKASDSITWVDLAHHAQVEASLARRTVVNMVRDGALQPVGWERREHSNRPMRTFTLASLAPAQTSAGVELGDAMAGWFRR